MLQNKRDREIWLQLAELGIELYVDDERSCTVDACGRPTCYSTAELVVGVLRACWLTHYRCQEHLEKYIAAKKRST